MAEFRGWGGAALVTGATSGIGLELAKLFAARGMDLILVARSAENLRILSNQLAKTYRVRALSVPMDLSRPDASSRLVEALSSIDLVVDVLVNNAAFGTYGPFAQQGVQRESQMLRLNIATPTELTALFLPGMQRRKRGLILNVASTAGLSPVPFMGTYAASKSYLVSWTHALAEELAGTAVRVAALCPGSTATNFHQVSGAATERARKLPQMTAAEVAAECMKGLDRGKRIIVPGRLNRVHALLAGLLPASFAASIARRFLGGKPKGAGKKKPGPRATGAPRPASRAT